MKEPEQVHIYYQTDSAGLDERLDRLMDALHAAGVPEPDLTAKLSTGEVHLVLGSNPPEGGH